MGNLLDIHKDILRKILRDYLNKADRILLLRAGGIKLPLHEDVINIAAENGHIDILKWLKENKCPWTDQVCAYAAANNHLVVLKWLAENNCPWNVWAYAWAAENGHLKVLKFLKEKGCPWSYYSWWISAHSVRVRDPEVLLWLKENDFPNYMK